MKVIAGDFGPFKYELSSAMREGKLFIYPTDTIYGIGCDATNIEAVGKIRKLKHRARLTYPEGTPNTGRVYKPFLVAVPSFDWIYEHCVVSEVQKQEIESKLPGRYSFILKLRDQNDSVAQVGVEGTIGIRMFDHPFQQIITEAGVPFVTTSVNIADETFAETIDEIAPTTKDSIDYIIDAGRLAGPPSQRIDMTS